MEKRIHQQNEQIGELMKDFVEQTVQFYNTLKEQEVCRPASEDTMEYIENLSIPANGRPVREVYDEMLRDVYAHTILAQHPRSFACIPSTESLISWMGDVMTNAYNPHASCEINAPVADLIEKKLIRWMCNLAGYPEDGGGLFVSGGSIANLTALTAARDSRLTYGERTRAVVYVSDQTHSSVLKGLHMIGFRKDQICTIPTDELFRMDTSSLQKNIEDDLANKKKPFAVIASAGTTNTGSVDPLTDISRVCKMHDLWMHVDGAFGASALLSEKLKDELAGIENSDSLSWDAHKWMLQTYGCSVVLVRVKRTLVQSFAAHPEYLKDAESSPEGGEFWDLGPELTRPARGLKLWLTLQTMGSKRMREIIDHGCAMAELAERIIRRNPEWEVVSPAQLGVINFRYVSDRTLPDHILNEINQHISKEITDSGFAQIFTTELQDKKVLRMCTIHPETTENDIYDTVERLMKSAIFECTSSTFSETGSSVA